MKTIKPASAKPSGSRKEAAATPARRWFGWALASIPLLFFLVLEGSLRLFSYRGNPDLFVPVEWQGRPYYQINPEFSKRFFFTLKSPPTPTNDLVRREKPANGLRIFYLGESSAAGYPYGHNGMPSRVIADVLRDRFPDREIEVINMGMSAINSYALYDMTDEILALKPDAIFIYTGHNEYYGALGIGSNESLGAFPPFVRFYLKIQRLRTFLLLRDGMTRLMGLVSGRKIDQSRTLMERVVKEQIIALNSPVYAMGIRQFRSNMEALLEDYREAGVPVYLSTVVSNERDFAPFESVAGDTSVNANAAFEAARAALAAGDSASSVRLFQKARELDALRFRAPDDINRTIRALADSNAVFLVDAEAAMDRRSPLGIPGNEWFLEHLHPTWQGNHLIGRTFSEAFFRAGPFRDTTFAVSEAGWADYRDRMFITPYDEFNCFHRLQVLYSGWPFRKNKVDRDAYMRTYTLKNVYDSIAVKTVHGTTLWPDGKLEAARTLASRNRKAEAAREYEGLHRDDPDNVTPLDAAARLYLDLGLVEAAHRVLLRHERVAPTPFSTKMLGITALQLGDTPLALRQLEKARENDPADPQVLYNLSGAYGLNRQFERAQQVLDELKKRDPGFPGIAEWQAEINKYLN